MREDTSTRVTISMRTYREARVVIDEPWRDPRFLGVAQGTANILGGVWPLASINTFEGIFGRKVDRWLVYTVACLLVANGTSQVLASRAGEVKAARWIGMGTAASLGVIDAIFVPRGRIRWTYALDGAMEAAWLALWARARMPRDVVLASEVIRSSAAEVRFSA
jgi:hypothetical protein